MLARLPPELRLKVFEQLTKGLRFSLRLDFQHACSVHGLYEDQVLAEKMEFAVVFTNGSPPIESSKLETRNHVGLLGVNRAIRADFAGFLSTTNLQMNIVPVPGPPCSSCQPTNAISNSVHEPWKSLVTSLSLLPTPPSHRFLRPPTISLRSGFPSLRCIQFPTTLIGNIAHRTRFVMDSDPTPIEPVQEITQAWNKYLLTELRADYDKHGEDLETPVLWLLEGPNGYWEVRYPAVESDGHNFKHTGELVLKGKFAFTKTTIDGNGVVDHKVEYDASMAPMKKLFDECRSPSSSWISYCTPYN